MLGRPRRHWVEPSPRAVWRGLHIRAAATGGGTGTPSAHPEGAPDPPPKGEDKVDYTKAVAKFPKPQLSRVLMPHSKGQKLRKDTLCVG